MKGVQGKSIQVKHLHLIRSEELSSGQDGAAALYPTWSIVRVAEGCEGVSVTVSIVSNADVK